MVDLFTSWLNQQLKKYVSWRSDPFALATNALQFSWSDLRGYALPPFALIGQCLQKINTERCIVLLIAPNCALVPCPICEAEVLADKCSVTGMHPSDQCSTYNQLADADL